MLSHLVADTEPFFAELRQREFARLDANHVAYLDHAGSGLYAESHINAHRSLLARSVFGNPHSAHSASGASTAAIDAARRQVLRFLDATDDYVVCFTANASAAIKLVAESYPFGDAAGCVLTADNHNSVNGIREFAGRAGAAVDYLPLRDDLRLDHPEARLAQIGGGGLFAFPAQSNFSGVHHPLSLVAAAQSMGYHVLLDAAAFVPVHPLSLRACPADFVALSFYKVFGYPSGLGALVAKRDALEALTRPWFAGGTIEYASVQLRRHRLRPLHDGFEDGTASFLDIAALEPGFAFRHRIGATRLSGHVMALTRELLDGLTALRHRDGGPLIRLYGPGAGDSGRGGTVTFNVLDRDGRCVPFGLVEDRANAAGVQIRGGCFCNPGAAEAAFRFDADRMSRCLDSLADGFSIPRLQQCLGPDVAAGAVRASIGLANNQRDIRRALDIVASFSS
jgi:selenocysteine lyase/cysteine desulfurase